MEELLYGLAAVLAPFAGGGGIIWLVRREPKHVRDLRKLEVAEARQAAEDRRREQRLALTEREQHTYQQFLRDKDTPAP